MAEEKKSADKGYECLQYCKIITIDHGTIVLDKGKITEDQFNRVKTMLPQMWQHYVKAL